MTEAAPILIVDDHEDDLQTLAELVQRANVPNPIELFRSGDEVIAYLNDWCERAPGECGRSGLLLLDVRMPRMSGFDVLTWIRKHHLLHSLVVVMISHLEEADDAQTAMQMGAHSYLHKYPTPLTIAALAKLTSHQHA